MLYGYNNGRIMSVSSKNSIVILFVVLIAFILYLPFIFMGPASPLFTIHNYDASNHTVVVEILDSGNQSLMKETYEIGTESDISQKRPFLLSLPLSKGDFTFDVIVDEKNVGLYHVEIPHPHTMVNIRLYYEDYTGNMTPISVEVVAVA